MANKPGLFGGIALIAGTAIGAGMLALPCATYSLGFIPAALLLVLTWFFMTQTAFYFLEVNLNSKISNANIE